MRKRKIIIVLALILFVSILTQGVHLQGSNKVYAEEKTATESLSKYADPFNWAFLPGEKDKPVDVFFVTPTVYGGNKSNFTMDISNEKSRYSFVGAMNMEKGIYDTTCNFYAPFYQQASLSAYTLPEEQREPYLAYAYQDIRDAFQYYMEHYNGGKPIALAGFSQGADMVLRILEEFFDEPAYQDKLVAAYVIGGAVTDETLVKYPHLKMAEGESDYGCIISFNSESKHVKTSVIVPETTNGINPLNWKTDSTVALPETNRGACFTDYAGNINREVPGLCGAYLDPERGTLKITGISEKDYPQGIYIFSKGVYHIYDYQFFYRNLQQNVAVRANEMLKNRLLNPSGKDTDENDGEQKVTITLEEMMEASNTENLLKNYSSISQTILYPQSNQVDRVYCDDSMIYNNYYDVSELYINHELRYVKRAGTYATAVYILTDPIQFRKNFFYAGGSTQEKMISCVKDEGKIFITTEVSTDVTKEFIESIDNSTYYEGEYMQIQYVLDANTLAMLSEKDTLIKQDGSTRVYQILTAAYNVKRPKEVSDFYERMTTAKKTRSVKYILNPDTELEKTFTIKVQEGDSVEAHMGENYNKLYLDRDCTKEYTGGADLNKDMTLYAKQN